MNHHLFGLFRYAKRFVGSKHFNRVAGFRRLDCVNNVFDEVRFALVLAPLPVCVFVNYCGIVLERADTAVCVQANLESFAVGNGIAESKHAFHVAFAADKLIRDVGKHVQAFVAEQNNVLECYDVFAVCSKRVNGVVHFVLCAVDCNLGYVHGDVGGLAVCRGCRYDNFAFGNAGQYAVFVNGCDFVVVGCPCYRFIGGVFRCDGCRKGNGAVYRDVFCAAYFNAFRLYDYLDGNSRFRALSVLGSCRDYSIARLVCKQSAACNFHDVVVGTGPFDGFVRRIVGQYSCHKRCRFVHLESERLFAVNGNAAYGDKFVDCAVFTVSACVAGTFLCSVGYVCRRGNFRPFAEVVSRDVRLGVADGTFLPVVGFVVQPVCAYVVRRHFDVTRFGVFRIVFANARFAAFFRAGGSFGLLPFAPFVVACLAVGLSANFADCLCSAGSLTAAVCGLVGNFVATRALVPVFRFVVRPICVVLMFVSSVASDHCHTKYRDNCKQRYCQHSFVHRVPP